MAGHAYLHRNRSFEILVSRWRKATSSSTIHVRSARSPIPRGSRSSITSALRGRRRRPSAGRPSASARRPPRTISARSPASGSSRRPRAAGAASGPGARAGSASRSRRPLRPARPPRPRRCSSARSSSRAASAGRASTSTASPGSRRSGGGRATWRTRPCVLTAAEAEELVERLEEVLQPYLRSGRRRGARGRAARPAPPAPLPARAAAVTRVPLAALLAANVVSITGNPPHPARDSLVRAPDDGQRRPDRARRLLLAGSRS